MSSKVVHGEEVSKKMAALTRELGIKILLQLGKSGLINQIGKVPNILAFKIGLSVLYYKIPICRIIP